MAAKRQTGGAVSLQPRSQADGGGQSPGMLGQAAHVPFNDPVADELAILHPAL